MKKSKQKQIKHVKGENSVSNLDPRLFGGGYLLECPDIQLTKSCSIVIAVGLLSAASIQLSIDLPVVWAPDLDSFESSARAVRDRFPRKDIILAGYDDIDFRKGLGVSVLRLVSSKYHGFYVHPPVIDNKLTTFHDLYQLRGRDAVAAEIRHLMAWMPA